MAGRHLLLGLRLAVLGLLTLLLVNPVVPGSFADQVHTSGPPWVLVDPDLSLAALGDDGRPLWDEVVTRASAEADRGAVLSVVGPPGTGPEGIDRTTLAARGPSHPTGDLLDAIRRLAETGADTIRVVATFRRDPAFLERLEAETPVPLVLERIGGLVRNAGVAELELPDGVRSGEEVEGRLIVFHEGAVPGDTVSVEVRAQGTPVRTLRIPLEEPRGRTEIPLRLPPPPDTGQVRYTARVGLEGDRFPADDERVRRVRVGEPEGGILLVSLQPDWEPRNLLPVLTAVTGLPGEGFLRLGERLFLPLVSGDGPLGPATPEGLALRLSGARLLVIHGVDDGAPEWLRAGARDHPRVIHLPAGPGGARLAGVEAGPPRIGEWTVDPELPPSVLAPFLEGAALGGLPPLAGVMAPTGTSGGAPALLVRDSGGGGSVPVVLLREAPGGRRVVVLAAGFWRWGARTGNARRAYRGLWAGAADWLLAHAGPAPGSEVRPARPVQPRGERVEWRVPSDLEGIEITLFPDPTALRPDDPPPADLPAPTFRDLLEPDEEGRAWTPPLPPGAYRYGAASLRSVSGDVVETRGGVEVEAWVSSLVHPPLDVPDRVAPSREGLAALRASVPGGRPLRTHVLPWALILLLLCAEWVGRRRVGLR